MVSCGPSLAVRVSLLRRNVFGPQQSTTVSASAKVQTPVSTRAARCGQAILFPISFSVAKVPKLSLSARGATYYVALA